MNEVKLVLNVVDSNNNTIYFVDDKGNKYYENDYENLLKTSKEIYDFGQYTECIKITHKVRDKDGILWYCDEDNRHYELGQIKSFIKNKKTSINMYLRDGIPTSYDGKIETFYKKDDILVVIEDSKGGYSLYKWFLESSFPLVHFHFVSSHGYANLFTTLVSNSVNYDKIIVIFDNKLEESGLNKQIESMTNYLINSNKNYFYFTPISLEEVILSFKEFLHLHNINNPFIDMCYNVYNKNELYYDYRPNLLNYYIPSLNLTVNNLETFLTDLLVSLTKGSALHYNNKKVSRCLISNCCNQLSTIFYTQGLPYFRLKYYEKSCNINDKFLDKSKYYAENTILYSLYKSCLDLILNNIIDVNYKYINI